jgi:outer membrane protein insertion porin family
MPEYAARLTRAAVLAAFITMNGVLQSAFCAPIVGSVRLDGTGRFTTRELLDWLATRAGASFSPATLQNDFTLIASLYRREGFLAATASCARVEYSEDSARVDLLITVEEGKRTVLGSLTLSGVTALTPDGVLAQFDTRVGDPLDETGIEADIAVLLTRYERIGYPFVRCLVDSIRTRSEGPADSLDLLLRVEEGSRLTIDELRVEGNTETDTEVIVRESRIRYGEVYDPVRVRTIRQRLTRLNIFTAVNEPEVYVRRERGGLLLRVQEGNPNTFDGIAGYIPSGQAGESGYLTGMASVSMRNLFGTGRKLNVRWQKEDRHSQELALGYREPWLFGQPLNAGVEFQQRQQDSSYVRQFLRFQGELMLSEEISISILGGTENVIPSDDSTAQRPPRATTLTIGAELLFDTRDDLYSPTTGARYRADAHYGRKTVVQTVQGGMRRESVQRFGVDADLFLGTFTRQVLAFGVHGRQIQSGSLDESELFRFGGANTLRGYRENQFVGSRVGWAATEYRFLMARRSFVYGFVDVGYYYRPADLIRNMDASEAFHYGYGFGIRFDTSLGNLGVSFALGKGDSFARGKVHFGLINEF